MRASVVEVDEKLSTKSSSSTKTLSIRSENCASVGVAPVKNKF